MIRERVSTQGIIRPLEPEPELDAFAVPEEVIGTISELAIKRYIDGDTHFRRKFAHVYKTIEKTRKKRLERAANKEDKQLEALRAFKNGNRNDGGPNGNQLKDRERIINSPGWGYAWALDELERPPPSSIVARRDTEEARKLARIADQAIMEDTSELNANSLWSVMMDFLTVTPDRANNGSEGGKPGMGSPDIGNGKAPEENGVEKGRKKARRTISQLFLGHR